MEEFLTISLDVTPTFLLSTQLGKNKKDAASSVECYMKEHQSTGDEAAAVVSARVEDMWRKLNQACMEIDHELQPLVHLVVKIARTNEIMYVGGRDAYTFGKDLQDHVNSLFLKPTPYQKHSTMRKMYKC